MLQMRLLPKLDNFQIVIRIFTVSLLPRVRFLMSTLPAGAAQKQFAAWDACVVEVLTAVLKQAPPKHAFLPLIDGGLGLFLVSERHAELFLRGKECALRVAKQHFPELACAIDAARAAQPTRALGHAPRTARATLPDAPAVCGSYPVLSELSSSTAAQARTAGKELKTAVSKHYKAPALLALDASRERMPMVPSGQKGVGAYLTVAPRFAHLRLTDVEARAATLIRLGLPHACMEAVGGADKLSRHTMRKKGAGGAHRRTGATRRRRVRIVAWTSWSRPWRHARWTLWTTPSSATARHPPWSVARPHWRTRCARWQLPEKDTAAKYDTDKPAGSTYITFAQGTQCELGAQAVKWLQKWAQDVAQLVGGRRGASEAGEEGDVAGAARAGCGAHEGACEVHLQSCGYGDAPAVHLLARAPFCGVVAGRHAVGARTLGGALGAGCCAD
jgi:hypothetical protein